MNVSTHRIRECGGDIAARMARTSVEAPNPRTFSSIGGIMMLSLMLSACADAPLEEAGSLASYDGLAQSDGMLAKSKLRIDKNAVMSARTVRIIPTEFAEKARIETVTDAQRKLVANAVDRSLCIGLSERLQVVPRGEAADLTVHAVVTRMAPTDENAVAATKVVQVAKTVLLPGVPAPVPRLPIGLGALSMEAEARDPNGQQVAAMVWGRGANALGGSARISKSGDAYELAGNFGDDFAELVVAGKSPYGHMSNLPSADRMKALSGGEPKYAVCDSFGRAPGVAGLIGGALGTPPEWSDKGASETAESGDASQGQTRE